MRNIIKMLTAVIMAAIEKKRVERSIIIFLGKDSRKSSST